MPTVKLIKWGNSIGIRIPSTIMKEAHLVSGETLKIMADENGEITLKSLKNQQEGWTDMFNAIADADNEELLLDTPNNFDEDEWIW
jgi:antitoxin component of MazEF toxin-antitoxin module